MAEKSSAFCDEGTRYESIEPGKPELPRSRSYVVQVGALGIWRGHGLSPILESRDFGNFELFAAQRTLHRRIPALIRFEGLACEERFAGCTQPDGDRLRSWIGIAEHAMSKITRPPQTGLHSGRRIEASVCRFN